MANSDAVIDEVIGTMNELVARDGGLIELSSYLPSDKSIHVNYRVGQNDECSTCLITPEMLKDFLLESFRSHGMDVDEVDVHSP
jgi:Fe-S cluster biogenesis protein NfuA